MLKFVVLCAAMACALGAAVPDGMLPQLDGRIVGGSVASTGKYPYQVSLQRNGAHFCGGTIYSNIFVITAAHCMRDVYTSSLRVRAGAADWSIGGVLAPVACYTIHEGYNMYNMINDIAIVRLSTALAFNSNIKTIGLATKAPVNGAAAVVSGWGKTSTGGSSIPNTLRYVNVNIIDRVKCASSEYGYGSDIRPTMICAAAKGKDACQGDSGGPLVSGSLLVGVVSWGYGCAIASFPGVYADVADLHSWVLNNTYE